MAPVLVSLLLLGMTSPPVSSVDLTQGWRFHPDAQNAGTAGQWFAPSFDDSSWKTLAAGKRWEDQGFPDLNGYAWYRHWANVPGAWRGGRVWLVLGGVNDACVVYCNGRRINSYGDHAVYSVNDVPLAIDITRAVRYGERNLIAIEVFDWGGSGGLWQEPCLLTNDPARLPPSPAMAWYTEDAGKQLAVEVECRSLGNDRHGAVAQVTLSAKETGPIATKTVDVSDKVDTAHVRFDLPTNSAGSVYYLATSVKDADGRPLGGAGAPLKVALPGPARWPGKYSHLRVLNNFVTELLHAKSGTIGSSEAFENPREGWVFFSLSGGKAGASQAKAFLDSEKAPLVWRVNPDTRALEAMRYLKAGSHRLRVEHAKGRALEVRAVPELAYCYYLANPIIAAQGAYDRAFLDRYVLSNVNTLVASGTPPASDFAAWRREGRHWLANASLPGAGTETAPSAAEVYAAWSANAGVTDPGYAGMIVDEFMTAGATQYRSWTGGMTRLYADPRFAGKTFYAWCGELYREPQCRDFCRALMARDGRYVWEVYLPENPTLEEAQRSIRLSLQHRLTAWEHAAPHTREHMVICLGYLSAPPESLDTNPGVDYNVFWDMQMHLLATAPAFWNIYGVLPYSASYSDEETLRWIYRMFRHYCIEGKRTRLITTPYELSHLKNPDFMQGTQGWRVEAAEPGSVTVAQMDGLSWLEGRYPKTTRGNQYLRFRRSDTGPNRVTQTVEKLVPGHVYSLKLLAADVGHLDVKSVLGLTIHLDGVEVIKDRSFQYPYPSNYAHKFGPYNREHPAWFNYYRVVFRAKANHAELTISDWSDNNKPGGAAGQEIGFNFVEVEPYLLP